MKLTLTDLQHAQANVVSAMPPTPHYQWPLLSAELGVACVVKHENATPTGAFKVRGGLNYVTERSKRTLPSGLISATRGNHGQSIAFACRRVGLPCTIVVPHGNAVEKNSAMRAFGAELIEFGADFDEAKQHAAEIAEERGLEFVPSFAPELVAGVASYALELFDSHTDLDTVYVPIGLGSGICGTIAARDALGLKTKSVGVVSSEAQTYRLSCEAGKVITTNTAATFADGMAVRQADPVALELISTGAERLVTVTDPEIAEAIRLLFRTTHHVAEGAGAAALAGLIQERERMAGKRVGVILCGQNIDTPVLTSVLSGNTPAP